MKQFAYIIILAMIFNGTGYTQNIREMRDQTDASDFMYNAKAGLRFEEQQKNAATLYASSKSIGFFEFRNNTFKSDPIGNMLTSAITGPDTYDNVLLVKFFCDFKNSIIPIGFRNKIIRWKTEISSDSKGSFVWRESQTDNNGILRVRFSSLGSARSGFIVFNFLDIEKKISLQNGPFEINLSEQSCSNKKK